MEMDLLDFRWNHLSTPELKTQEGRGKVQSFERNAAEEKRVVLPFEKWYNTLNRAGKRRKRAGTVTYKEEFIYFMVRSGVLTFGDFTTKSGRRTPYFINTGNYKTGAQAARLGDYYAACIQENLPDGIDCLFGPAYKGIPLAVSAAASLYRNYGRDLPYCFNRKEAKDHGEGGSMVGYRPKVGDRIAIVEDVVTAGTAVRESLELFRGLGEMKVTALVVSVDRMERGSRACSTLDELRQDYGIRVCPIVTVREVMDTLHNRPVDGVVYIDDAMRERMEGYLQEYGAR